MDIESTLLPPKLRQNIVLVHTESVKTVRKAIARASVR